MAYHRWEKNLGGGALMAWAIESPFTPIAAICDQGLRALAAESTPPDRNRAALAGLPVPVLGSTAWDP